MRILNTIETNEMLFNLKMQQKLKIIISPFINHKKFLDGINNETEIITRFNNEVFTKGSSDFSLLKKIFSKGNKIYNKENLHSKIYVFENNIITGSSNLTISGLFKNQETNILLGREDKEYSQILKRIENEFNTKNYQEINKEIVDSIEEYLKTNKPEKKSETIKILAKENDTKNTYDILVSPFINIEEVNELCTKCFVKNENSFSFENSIKQQLKKSNYQSILFEDFQKLVHWAHPLIGNDNPYKTAAPAALELLFSLFSYIPTKKMVPRYDYFNTLDKQKVVRLHEENLENIFIKREEENFEIIWNRITRREGEQFYLKNGKDTFTYKINENEEFIPQKPITNPPKVSKQKIKEAYDMWPVQGPGVYNKAEFMAPSYIWGVFNDLRIIQKER